MDTRKKLIDDAKAAGMTVIDYGAGATIVRRAGPRSRGVILWGNGKTTRSDIDLAHCTLIPNLAAVRKVLGLKEPRA